MTQALRFLFIATLAVAALQNAAAIALTVHPDTYHIAVAFGEDTGAVGDIKRYGIDWTDKSHATISGNAANSEVELAPDNSSFQHKNLSVSTQQDAGLDAAESYSYFYFTLTEAVHYALSGAFAVSIDASSGTVFSQFYAQLYNVTTSTVVAYEYEENVRHSGSRSFDHQLDGIGTGNLQNTISGSLTGTLGPGDYILEDRIQVLGKGSGSGTGGFTLELTAIPTPDTGSTLALLGAAFLGLITLRRKLAA